jgi:hypothetical protein
MMLKPIKTFYIQGSPTATNFEEARDIAKQESCVVELRWVPDILTGWWHDYIFEDSNLEEWLAKKY